MFYKLSDIRNTSEIPQDLLRQEVKEVVVEFTNGGPDIPHAELRLILAQGVDLDEDNGTKTVYACSMGSNPHLVPRPHLEIYSTCTLRTEETSYGNMHSLASFIFKPRRRMARVSQYLAALSGKHPYYPTNLLQFDSLVRMPNLGDKLGYESRDVVAQWVVRLAETGFMGWTAKSLKSPYDRLVAPENPPLKFHKFIAKGYEELEDGTIRMTHDIQMYEGKFLDQEFDRLYTFLPPRSYRPLFLPYRQRHVAEE
ncbi:unnamed protein product [Clonostachys rosea f. rosea IK726]|uniref:Uncharacterized protein n=1 Tax=Clonostachys rosea f. rosea IK726 TaxID=1349383 RepID=A0ACA9TWD0_BIOOC|nr:unnamed protein product [Clonostachys rosea f. rosea IK726]